VTKNPLQSPETIELDDELLRDWPLPPAAIDDDKEDRGRVLVIAGSAEIAGAAVLAATGALRAGAGKVTVATVASIARSLAFAVPESRVIALEETKAGGIAARAADALAELTGKTSAVLIGPGMVDGKATCELAARLMRDFPKTQFLLDAAAMGVIHAAKPGSARSKSAAKNTKPRRFSRPALLTPHAGEMAALTGRDKELVQSQPRRAALELAQACNAIVALKGATTYIAAPDGRVWQHDGANPGLGTSGSGDVLAGVIAGLVARGAPLEQAAAWGVALHARAGAKLARRYGPLGYLARELAAEIPALMGAYAPSPAQPA
jgi:ADP-dependent NAD(P)H-hydrate dehydratase